MDSTSEKSFWDNLDRLVEDHSVTIDRPRQSTHPRYPEVVYPLDYGYLEQTTTIDQGGIDVWIGRDKPTKMMPLSKKTVSAVILTVDLLKSDAELKIALYCDEEDFQTILSFYKNNKMGAMVVRRTDNWR